MKVAGLGSVARLSAVNSTWTECTLRALASQKIQAREPLVQTGAMVAIATVGLAVVAIQLTEIPKSPVAAFLRTWNPCVRFDMDSLSVALDRVLLSIDLGAAWMGTLVSALDLDSDIVVSLADDRSSQIGKGCLCSSSKGVYACRKDHIVVVVVCMRGHRTVDGCRSWHGKECMGRAPVTERECRVLYT